jgi:hypothetical protein
MGYITLHNVNPKEKRARYYALTWSPVLTDNGWAVERAWGPLHSKRRQQKTDFVEDQASALNFVARHLCRRLQHGYAIKGADLDGQILVSQRIAVTRECAKDHESEV